MLPYSVIMVCGVCFFLQLVLAFGNYMNSMKKGYAVGFKLESLSKVREVIRSVAKCVMQRSE